MPNHKACEKSLRQDKKRAARNSMVLATLRTLSKKLVSDISLEEKEALVVELSSKLDKAAKRHIIHKNKASRKKSRIALYLNKEKSAAQAQ